MTGNSLNKRDDYVISHFSFTRNNYVYIYQKAPTLAFIPKWSWSIKCIKYFSFPKKSVSLWWTISLTFSVISSGQEQCGRLIAVRYYVYKEPEEVSVFVCCKRAEIGACKLSLVIRTVWGLRKHKSHFAKLWGFLLNFVLVCTS